ncbi:MAG: hypothetical protein Q4C96_04515 [Planctomycetia bacterium]|nr:hypothetical protein [Planctomycetia bacterium]
MESKKYSIEKQKNGTLIVRMHSQDTEGNKLPDAVFTFRPNDPQYELWLKKYNAVKSDIKNT